MDDVEKAVIKRMMSKHAVPGTFFRAEHHQTFARLFLEGEDAAADLYEMSRELQVEGSDWERLEEIRMALRSYRNLLLRIVGASPL